MRNQLLSEQLNALHAIGLDRVNTAVEAATAYIELLEQGVPSAHIEAEAKSLRENMDALETGYQAAQQQIVALTAEVELLQGELIEANSRDVQP